VTRVLFDVAEYITAALLLGLLMWAIRRRINHLEARTHTAEFRIGAMRNILLATVRHADAVVTLAADDRPGDPAGERLRPALLALWTMYPTFHYLPCHTEPYRPPCDHPGRLWVREMVHHNRWHWVAVCHRCAGRWQQTSLYVPASVREAVQRELALIHGRRAADLRLPPLCASTFTDPAVHAATFTGPADRYMTGAVFVFCDHPPLHKGPHQWTDSHTATGTLTYRWEDDDPGAAYVQFVSGRISA